MGFYRASMHTFQLWTSRWANTESEGGRGGRGRAGFTVTANVNRGFPGGGDDLLFQSNLPICHFR